MNGRAASRTSNQKVWSSNPVKTIGGVRVSIRNIAIKQFGIRIFLQVPMMMT